MVFFKSNLAALKTLNIESYFIYNYTVNIKYITEYRLTSFGEALANYNTSVSNLSFWQKNKPKNS